MVSAIATARAANHAVAFAALAGDWQLQPPVPMFDGYSWYGRS